MNTDVIVRAVPSRREYVDGILRQLPGATVLWDDAPAGGDGRARSTAAFLKALLASGDRPCIHM